MIEIASVTKAADANPDNDAMIFDDPLAGGADLAGSMPGRIARPGKIVCIGRNYREHAKELGNDVPVDPLFFLKPSSSIIGEGEAIVLPPQSERVEFEGEIGILIGSVLTKGTEAEAVSAIAGIVAINDVTARDLQKKDSQWTRAKGFDTFCPIGNVAYGEHDLSSLTVITRVNGEEKQRASATDMVFSIPMLLSYVSHVMTLEPGDLVATGTPAGVSPLKDGDVVEVEVEGLSRVSNPVRSSR
jgi:2-keto-4-pentenoate hydratase/2-oxohepta-3-ene-1,7-dioic acid hydratase in catechol pathway